jgi:hypothetical protein
MMSMMKNSIFLFYSLDLKVIQRGNYQLIEVTMNALLMEMSLFRLVGAVWAAVSVMGKSVVKVCLGCYAYGKNNQQEEGNNFSYGCISLQQRFIQLITFQSTKPFHKSNTINK